MDPKFFFGLLVGIAIAAALISSITEREAKAHFKKLLEQLKCR